MELFVCFFSLVLMYMNWISYKISMPVPVTKVLLSTLLRFQRFDASMRKTFENDRIARCDVS